MGWGDHFVVAVVVVSSDMIFGSAYSGRVTRAGCSAGGTSTINRGRAKKFDLGKSCKLRKSELVACFFVFLLAREDVGPRLRNPSLLSFQSSHPFPYSLICEKLRSKREVFT